MGVLNCPRHFVIMELTIVVCSALLCGERVLLVGVGGGGRPCAYVAEKLWDERRRVGRSTAEQRRNQILLLMIYFTPFTISLINL